MTTTPIHSAYDGQVIENLDLYVNSGDAITVTHDNVIIRNCRIHHAEGDGVSLSGASHVTIENCEIINSSPPTGINPETSTEIRNITGWNSPYLTVHNVTVREGSTGIWLGGSPGANLSHLEGYNFHGPFPRGQFVQFDKSGDSSLTDFYAFNDAGNSYPEDIVSVYASPNTTVSRGVIDGNNSVSGVGVMFENGSTGGRVDYVDAIHQGNGAFSSYSSDVVFDHTRSFDNIYADQGRGPSLSNALIWNVSSGGISILNSTYTDPGNPQNIVWDRTKAVTVDVHQDATATPMQHITNQFDWIVPPPSPPPPPPPSPPPPPPATPGGANTTIGSGSDVLVLKITQDAYQGDSQYAVYVDGKQLGATLTAKALHGSGEFDTLQVKGDWAAGSHTVSVTLLNDLWGGTTSTDRNLYVESATYDGVAVTGSNLAIMNGTPKSFNVTDTTAVPGSTTPPPTQTLNEITGTYGSDVINGTSGDDSISGLRRNDVLSGNDGADLIIGGTGRDTLSGGAGDDRFVFSSISDSKIASPDLIQDFQSGDGIDLEKIDANTGLTGDQSFKWIGSNNFSDQAGELRAYFNGTNTIVEANVNGDATADFQILVNGMVTLNAVDFLL